MPAELVKQKSFYCLQPSQVDIFSKQQIWPSRCLPTQHQNPNPCPWSFIELTTQQGAANVASPISQVGLACEVREPPMIKLTISSGVVEEPQVTISGWLLLSSSQADAF